MSGPAQTASTLQCLQHEMPSQTVPQLSCWSCAGLEHVAQMSQLTHLNLRDCRLLTNDGLRRLAPLKGLKSLALSNASGVTDKGLQCLAELTGARRWRPCNSYASCVTVQESKLCIT